jgi:ATP synthase protein I
LPGKPAGGYTFSAFQGRFTGPLAIPAANRDQRLHDPIQTHRRTLVRALVPQVAIVALAAAIALVAKGGAWSLGVLAGGGAVAAGSWVSARIGLGGGVAPGAVALARILAGMLAKWIVVAGVLVAAVAVAGLPPVAVLLGALAALAAWRWQGVDPEGSHKRRRVETWRASRN